MKNLAQLNTLVNNMFAKALSAQKPCRYCGKKTLGLISGYPAHASCDKENKKVCKCPEGYHDMFSECRGY